MIVKIEHGFRPSSESSSHIANPRVFVECSQCKALKSCFCNDCTYSEPYSNNKKDQMEVIFKQIEDDLKDKDESPFRTFIFSLVGRGNVYLCSDECFHAYKLMPVMPDTQ